MFMKNLEFNDKNIELKYKNVLARHSTIDAILNTYSKNDDICRIMDILEDEYSIQVIVSNNSKLINIYIDILAKKIKIIDDTKEYVTIYDDLPKKLVCPIGYLYENDSLNVFKKHIVSLTDQHIYFYEINDINNTYTLIISYKNIKYDENDFINHILNSRKTSNIKNLFLDVSKYLNINLFDLKLTDSKGSIIITKDGELVKYIEYIENKNNYSKIYLENDDFYIEKIVKEKYNDESLHLLKEIGENNGKEKKRS